MILIDPLTCMAAAIYFESRGELPYHQAMVAQTVINRVESKRFPNTVCGVVKQKHQFSFYWDGYPEKVKDTDAWNDSVMMAMHVMKVEAKITYACHYAHKDINNYWTRAFSKTKVQAGNHIFYEGGC